MRSLEQRANSVYNQLNNGGVALVKGLEKYFTDYFLGEKFEPHPDMVEAIRTSELGEDQKGMVREYAFLQCAQNSLNRVSERFVQLFDINKFNPSYSLENFLMSWDENGEKFIQNEDEFGTYAHLFIGLVEHLEKNREIRGHSYDENYDIGEGFSKLGLISVLTHNLEDIRGIIFASLNDETRKKIEDITSDKLLAQEAGNSFLDAYDGQRENSLYKRGLREFLDRYNVNEGNFASNRAGGQFRAMLRRLMQRHGERWREEFYGMLENPVKTRVERLDEDLGRNGINYEDRIRFVERLASEDLLKFVYMLNDEGSDASDVLLASMLDKLSESEREILRDLTRKSKKTLGEYLGVCRVPVADTEIKYDARRSLDELCKAVNPEVYGRSETVASILLNKMRASYSDEFQADEEGTIEKLRKEVEGEENNVRKDLLQQTLRHYELRQKVKGVWGLVSHLVVVK